MKDGKQIFRGIGGVYNSLFQRMHVSAMASLHKHRPPSQPEPQPAKQYTLDSKTAVDGNGFAIWQRLTTYSIPTVQDDSAVIAFSGLATFDCNPSKDPFKAHENGLAPS